jgi:tetratricopeptide (TPR) repeat protein
MGEPSAALDELSSGLALWPSQPIARFTAALAAEQLGDFDRAIEEYRYAIRASALLEARMRLARLHQALNQPRRALTALRHDPSGSDLPVEAALLELELLATISPDIGALRPGLNRPELRGRVVAAVAAGTRRRVGRAAAARVVLSASQLDLADPAYAPALESLMEDLWAIGETEQALERIERVREGKPESAVLLALHAEALEHAGKTAEARASYARALALEPGLPRALRGTARLTAATNDAQVALRAYETATSAAEAAGSEDSRALIAATEILVGDGRSDEARVRLEAWLANHPLDAAVALRLAELAATAENGTESARVAAHRAVRLGAGPEAIALAEQLDSRAATP